MKLLVSLTVVIIVTISSSLARPPTASNSYVAPPAGRALYYRGANHEPYDFPESTHATFDRKYHRHPDFDILGPPGFWTEPSLREHYEATAHLRFHPKLYDEQPPFQDWLKERQLMAAIHMMRDTITLETSNPKLDPQVLLQHEMQLGELSVLLRTVQIAIKLRYGVMEPAVREYEEAIYRAYMSFLELSQRAEPIPDVWKHHVEYVKQQGQVQMEDEQHQEHLTASGDKQNQRLADAIRAPNKAQSSEGRARIPGIATAPQSPDVREVMQKSASDRWATPVGLQLHSLSKSETVEELQKALQRGFAM
ncbi:hypothetical protein EX895_001476 [Sporisorium graminicola]|uniref:Uncharacterized protein n=1 Tax=Sporisorium graminicola TaxID=280036 RepID=A0A4U7KXZ6_9BASI|nr:hypothetical protein EX895_001476 [Sporisorium graminicola]TKY89691.1 hypothetical protein EX895_001476 [Sporisorium graminicola]